MVTKQNGWIRGELEKLRAATQEIQLQIGPQNEGEEKKSSEDSSSAYPPDDVNVSRLPASIRGVKRWLENLTSLHIDSQNLEVGSVYSWNGVDGVWEKAISKRFGVYALGYAITEHTLQFWGITEVAGAVAGAKVFLSATVPGQISFTPSRHQLGVGVAKDRAFLDMIHGVME